MTDKNKKYKVLPKYYEYWGNSSNENDYIVTLEEIERLADEWDCTVDELMEQVEEI